MLSVEDMVKFFTGTPSKSPGKGMRQGLGKDNPQNLDALLESGEIDKAEYDRRTKAIQEHKKKKKK